MWKLVPGPIRAREGWFPESLKGNSTGAPACAGGVLRVPKRAGARATDEHFIAVGHGGAGGVAQFCATKRKSPEQVRDDGLQLPKAGSPSRGFWDSVPTEADAVNDPGIQFSRSDADRIGEGLRSITIQDVKKAGKHSCGSSCRRRYMRQTIDRQQADPAARRVFCVATWLGFGYMVATRAHKTKRQPRRIALSD